MQSINDADALSKFRAELRTLIENLDKSQNEIEVAIEKVSQTWKDSKFNQFMGKFNTDKQQIIPLRNRIAELEGTTLKRKEDKIRVYLSTGGNLGGVSAVSNATTSANTTNGIFTGDSPSMSALKEGIKNSKGIKQGRQPLSSAEINKLRNPDAQPDEVEKLKNEFREAGIKDGTDYNKLDKAFSKYHGLEKEEDLILEKVDFNSDANLAGKPYAGVHYSGSNVAKINSNVHSSEEISCKEVATIGHEVKHVSQNHASEAEKEIFRKGRVNFLDCEGDKVGSLVMKDNKVVKVSYEDASESCKIKYEDYLKSPSEVPAFQAGANAKQACEAIKIEQMQEEAQFLKEAQEQNLPKHLYERPKRIPS